MCRWPCPDRSCRVIRVNEPLFLPREGCPGWLGRYQVSQTDAEWDRPGYSGLGIVWDPGVGPARLGMVLMTLGTFLAFLARIRRRRREEEGA